mmetsp:Transcript_36033/g.87524  ORF Transcript_36033/g.87524 Transcript_36033/m.87524 type:complete len:348 (-) Transcript_36033:1822-2865(-)
MRIMIEANTETKEAIFALRSLERGRSLLTAWMKLWLPDAMATRASYSELTNAGSEWMALALNRSALSREAFSVMAPTTSLERWARRCSDNSTAARGNSSEQLDTFAAGAQPCSRRLAESASVALSSARSSGTGRGTAGPLHAEERKTPAGVSSMAGPVSTMREEMLRMESARKMRTTGKSSWQVVVQQSRLAERARFTTRLRYVPSAEARLGGGGGGGSGGAMVTECASGCGLAAGSSVSIGTASSPASRSCSCRASRSSAASLILRKTSSSVVHVAPYSFTPSAASDASSARRSFCSCARSSPGSCTTASMRLSEMILPWGAYRLMNSRTFAPLKAAEDALTSESE